MSNSIWDMDRWRKERPTGSLFDSNGKHIPLVFWADFETGLVKHYAVADDFDWDSWDGELPPTIKIVNGEGVVIERFYPAPLQFRGEQVTSRNTYRQGL